MAQPSAPLPAVAAVPAADRSPLPQPVPLGPDLQGATRLGFDAVVGITDVVEALHQSIAARAWPLGRGKGDRTRGITGMVYGIVRGTMRAIGGGADLLLGLLAQQLPSVKATSEREAVLAALNGVWGDHLERTQNPLAIPTTLRHQGQALILERAALAQCFPRASGRVVVLIHGLCMNDLQWARNGHHHGRWLEQHLDGTAVELHYNTGRHISRNGRDCAQRLQALVDAWPVPVTELVLLGHSMGGLVARSACHIAEQAGQSWLSRLHHLVFLGTPHQGAPMERGGRLIDTVLSLSPYLAPFARLGQARSDGINDLGRARLQDADWLPGAGGARHTGTPRPTPLPAGVRAHVVAAVAASPLTHAHQAWMGDGLVPLASALGDHPEPPYALHVPEADRLVLTGANHWDLLDRPEVAARLAQWLAPAA